MIPRLQNMRISPRVENPQSLLRLTILTLDSIAILLVCTTLGLYYNYAPSTETSDSADWNDPLVLSTLLISLLWTLIISFRPASNPIPLHPGHLVAWELICWIFLAGCTASALTLSSLLDYVRIDEESDDCSGEYGSRGWRCESRIVALQKLQIAAYSLALVIA